MPRSDLTQNIKKKNLIDQQTTDYFQRTVLDAVNMHGMSILPTYAGNKGDLGIKSMIYFYRNENFFHFASLIYTSIQCATKCINLQKELEYIPEYVYC